MKACVFRGPGQVEVVEVPTPEPGAGELVLRVAAAGLCASDVRVFKGEKYARHGVIPGHEIAGVVADRGPGVDAFDVGQPVALCPIIACGVCDFCRVGKRNRCPSASPLATTRTAASASTSVSRRRFSASATSSRCRPACRWTSPRCSSRHPAS